MHFVALKGQDRRMGGGNWPQMTRIKQIPADFCKSMPCFRKNPC